MKDRKRIFLLSSFLLLAIGLITFKFFTQGDTQPQNVDREVKGSETLQCDEETFSKVSKSLDLFSLKREWYLKGEDEYNTVDILIEDEDLNEEVVQIEYSLEGSSEKYLLAYDAFESAWVGSLNVDGLETGEHEMSLTASIENCDLTISKKENFKVSYPVYVTWSMDWEGFDVDQKYLDSITAISKKYDIPITQFFNPYIYINLSEKRSQYLTNWILERQISGDSIGLHLHMNNKMVRAAGVTPRTDVSWGGWAKDGQDIPNTVYGYQDYKKIINWARDQFVKYDLPSPTMYRAGGWFIDEENLRVLDDLGFVLDSSGRTYHVYGDNKLKGEWYLETTTQPYRLNSDNQNITNDPNMGLWEFPNNGGDSWAYSADDMISRFKDNYNGGISDSTKVVTYLSHPHWFNIDEPKINKVLDHVDKFGIVEDRGPVVYRTLDQIEIN
jgi:hypothetical protein